ncbi:MAG TPA: TIM barrel protein [Pirellulales bacterium]|nr:TIM barrel protein [Pirellulales bacterium]
MQRRQFLAAASAAAACGVSAAASRAGESGSKAEPFALKFAPHFGMFRHLAGKDLIDQLKFAADQGFTAWEDNGMISRPVEMQQKIAEAMERLGMELSVISALRGVWNGVNFAGADQQARDAILKALGKSVEVARRVRATRMTVVPGLEDPKLPAGYQTANCIELLRRSCDIVEPHGLVMVLEPLNRRTNHPGVFLYESPQAYLLCRAVDRPSCKILFDIYHQQVTEGNLIPNIDHCWNEIGYFQCADNPGRNEPGTGEINYARVFAHLLAKGYRGAVGMEHGNSQRGGPGETAVIEAYRNLNGLLTQAS